MTETFTGTIRRVWEPGKRSTCYTVIVQRHGDWRELTTWTRDGQLALACIKQSGPRERPAMTLQVDRGSKLLVSAEPVAEQPTQEQPA